MKFIKRDEVLEYVNGYIVKYKIADSYKELKLFCQVEGINATKQQIKTFLRNKAKEDGVDLSVLKTFSTPVDLVKTDESLIKRSADRFIEQIKASRYNYNREDLQYFNDLFRVYTTKCLKICSIISMLAGRRLLDKDLMEELDITVNEKEVLLSDIDRLLVPLTHNYSLALDTKIKAEQMDTYLNLNIDRSANNKAGIHYSECLPGEYLQHFFGGVDEKQYIALTEKQKKAYEEHLEESFNHMFFEDINY